MSALAGDALTKYNAQFQRSSASPLAEVQAPRLELDGAQVLSKYVPGSGANAAEMSGAEFYAVVGHIKRQHGPKGDALETELMKISRQKDKKLRLADWIAEHHVQPVAVAAAPPMSPAVPPMPRLDLASAGTAAPSVRPTTARPDYHNNASQMEAVFGSPRAAQPASGSMTARPSTAPAPVAAAPVADMSVIFASFCAGRDHVKMSGADYHSLVAWLKSKGHGDLEDMLIKVRLLGDKKFQLVKYMKEKCAELLPGGAAASGAITQEHYDMPGLPLPPQPMAVGGAQVLEMHHPPHPPVHQMYAPPPAAPVVAPPVAAPPIAAPPVVGGKSPLDTITELEMTVGRMEESFNFAIECMKDDMRQVKTQLAALRAVVAPQ